jgi:hypothetical protein
MNTSVAPMRLVCVTACSLSLCGKGGRLEHSLTVFFRLPTKRGQTLFLTAFFVHGTARNALETRFINYLIVQDSNLLRSSLEHVSQALSLISWS